jgi:hypothetical protein
VEVFATIVFYLVVVTDRRAIKGHISVDWNIPKDVDVSKYEQNHVQNVFCFLLVCNFDSVFVAVFLQVLLQNLKELKSMSIFKTNFVFHF